MMLIKSKMRRKSLLRLSLQVKKAKNSVGELGEKKGVS